ncbi:MAG TPA: hypothetical protein VKA13_08535 [Gammaproteobacteria bacterium]|nr:hypothetical protein [Gammaproteobacteria bacterium]
MMQNRATKNSDRGMLGLAAHCGSVGYWLSYGTFVEDFDVSD